MKVPMLQIVIIAKVPPSNEHLYLRVSLEKKKVRASSKVSSRFILYQCGELGYKFRIFSAEFFEVN